MNNCRKHEGYVDFVHVRLLLRTKHEHPPATCMHAGRNVKKKARAEQLRYVLQHSQATARSTALELVHRCLTMDSKTVLLKYKESRKKIVIPAEKGISDMAFVESSFRKLFKFEGQVNLTISFQRFDMDFQELVDLEENEELQDMEKLNVVVTSTVTTPPAVS